MPTAVSQLAAADVATAAQHFAHKLALETDCWDVHDSLLRGADFVLLDVRSPDLYAGGHIAGARNLPHAKIIEAKLRDYPADTLFVVHCAGPHCNGADRAALRLAKLGRKVKLMIGGITGWLDESFTLVKSET